MAIQVLTQVIQVTRRRSGTLQWGHCLLVGDEVVTLQSAAVHVRLESFVSVHHVLQVVIQEMSELEEMYCKYINVENGVWVTVKMAGQTDQNKSHRKCDA